MRPIRPAVELTARDREILRDVVQTFILVGEPVSSRSVAKHVQHGVSAATIRNVMADLEEWGYLEQPHTSAGRVPSSAGYHLYIESLMEKGSLSDDDRRRIDGDLHGGEAAPGRLVALTSQLLSRLSGQIGILVTPAIGDTVLRTVDFVPLSGRRVLCVVVSEAGFVENKLLESRGGAVARRADPDLELPDRELPRQDAAQHPRAPARRDDRRADADGRAPRTRDLPRPALARIDPGAGGAGRGHGAAAGARPELENLSRVRLLLDTFADRQRLVGLLSQCMDGSGVRVVIGEDSSVTSDLGFSLVARPFGAGERRPGNAGHLRSFAHGLRAHHPFGRLSGRIPVAGARVEREPIGQLELS